MNRYLITVEGIVQGVGFRPFVFNLAISLKLRGWVNNNSQGVFIDIEGNSKSLKIFLKTLEENPPPLAKIEKVTYIINPLINYVDFSIKESEILENTITLISPDISTCKDCIEDIKSTSNRRYKYPFTNCTNCGPRFSIIKAIPYDRDKTTMKNFKMCNSCLSEYTSPTNRRFHAQPNACKCCGPQFFITDNKGKLLVTEDPIEWAADALNNGKILAIKGLGGFHLVCDAKNISAIELLRRRKIRPEKPFAVMGKNITIIKRYCEVNKLEEETLTSIQKPIVLLKRSPEYFLPQAIAPKQNTIGFMLPFTPLHELLFDNGPDLLIMTSGNINSLPLEYENENAILNLSTIVDYFLMHNRDIHIPIDDSVVKIVNNELMVLRRARGYAPAPLKYDISNAILACGPNMKNTFCLSKKNFLFVSQHNGNLENLETIEHYKRNIEHYKNIFMFKPMAIACDLHPNYISSEYAHEYPLPKIQVQHHHAHIVSCMVENKLRAKVIGIAFDGTGYGTDGSLWGGEFMLCTISAFERVGHITAVPLPGGDIAASEPWRMAVSYINYALKDLTDITELVTSMFGEKALTILKMINSNINCFMTSSMGRFFDA
ncbi:MAG: carbamoyltransferase HypF, partial [Clostridiaceae bacterium]|nr:carbamoyltransferase HypF [Clostridiaceae bacterium]